MRVVRRGRGPRSVLLGLIAGLCAFAIPAATANADPWECDAFGYLFQTDQATPDDHLVQQVDLVSGDAPEIAQTPEAVNAVGYNVLDDFMYGTQFTFDAGGDLDTVSIVQIHDDGSADDLGLPPEMAATVAATGTGFHIGDVDANGHYWVAGPGVAAGTLDWFQVDLTTPTPTVLSQGTLPPPPNGGAGADWAWVNGAFYAVGGATGGADSRLLSFAPGAATWTDNGPLPIVGPTAGFGAVFVDAAGFLYASRNSDGFIFRINPANGATILVTDQGPASTGNDGARCADAPIPTITVTKTVDGRVDPADQFTVGLEDDGGTVLDSATTSGTDTSASTTNWPVSQGETYTITDAMAAGSASSLDEYDTSIECTDAQGDDAATGGAAPNWTLTVAVATDYTCEVTNAAVRDPRLTVRKRANRGTVRPGQRITYRIMVRNRGDGAASPATVCDRLPSTLTLVRASGSRRVSARRHCWTVNVRPGASRTFKVVARVKPGARSDKARNVATANARGTRVRRSPSTVRISPAPVCPAWLVKTAC